MSNSIKFNGKEVENPVLRVVTVVFVIAFILVLLFLVLPILGTLLMILAALCLFSVPLHFILRANGRRGFFSSNENEFTWTIDKRAFDRV